jgi:hypothetical protein
MLKGKTHESFFQILPRFISAIQRMLLVDYEELLQLVYILLDLEVMKALPGCIQTLAMFLVQMPIAGYFCSCTT